MSDQWEHDEEVVRRPLWRRRPVLIVAALVILIVIFFIFTQAAHRTKEAVKSQDAWIGAAAPYQPTAAEAAPVVPRPPPPPPLPPVHDAPAIPVFGNNKPQVKRPVLLSYAPMPRVSAPVEKEEAAPKQTGLDFGTKQLPGMKASPSIDSTYILMPGLLPCELDVAIDSNLPGPLACHLPWPVYSPKGVPLMEAGTQVIGRYESMTQNGVNRLMAVSTSAHTPYDIWVPLTDQPLADDLGRTGLDGSVDHRYLSRFGGAILLDLTQSVLQILQARASKGGDTYVSVNGSDQLASQILRATIDQPPIFTKHQGQLIEIWLTQPISFEDSYRIRSRVAQ